MTANISPQQPASKPSNALKKIEKAAARLADLTNGLDTEACLRVIREAKNAMHRIYDHAEKRMIEVPDHRTRLAAVMLHLAYVEGLPVKREVRLVQDFRSTDDVLADIRQSPEGMRTLRALSGLGASLEIEGEIIELEDAQDSGSVQETGGR